MDKFGDIRPYTDQEAREAFKRMASDPHIEPIAQYIKPGLPADAVRGLLVSLTSVWDFQHKVMYDVMKSIIGKTTAGVTYTGIENLKDGKTHLLISNHRDIILDPAIIQVLLYENKVHTTEIAVGDNLISSQFIEDITRSNGMIKVVRGGTPREIYSSSCHLSEYLRSKIATGECSAWIAQRNGRTKDGKDETSQGLVKMLQMSGSGDFAADFEELNIVPIAISYQYEPCDFLKARELYISRRQQYVKQPGEDLQSMLTGLTQYKGGVHYYFAPSLSREVIEGCAALDKNERYKAIAAAIDKEILSNYKLWNNNYIACDILEGTSNYEEHYSQSEKEAFIAYMEGGISKSVEKENDIDPVELREIFLGIYANPVKTKI